MFRSAITDARQAAGTRRPTLGLILRACELLGVSYHEIPEMREAIVADRIGRDPKMRDRLYLEVLNWREETPMPPPGAEESKRYRPRVVGRSRDSEHT